MKSDVLLHWMTHLGEGSWVGFRSAVARLADSDADVDALCRKLRIVLSDCAHVDFFVEGSRRWRVLPTLLGGLPMDDATAVLVGGQTPTLEAALTSSARARGCRVVKPTDEGPENRCACIRVEGASQDIETAAAEAGIPHVRNLAHALCSEIVPVPQQLESAPTEPVPGNWLVRSFDLDALTWVDGMRSQSACEFRSRHGERRYYLHTRRGKLFRIPKRDAVYAAAMINDVALTNYDAHAATLRTPTAAPLPQTYTRAASVCAGTVGRVERGWFIFESVPFEIAAFLLVAAGQPHPRSIDTRVHSVEGAEQLHGQPV